MKNRLKSKKEIFSSVDLPERIWEDTGVSIKRCFLCGFNQVKRLYMQAHFPIVKCRGCGLVYADEHFQMEDLQRFYTGDYYERAYVCHPPNIDQKIARDYVRVFDKVDQLLGGGNLLDFGTARGTFLRELRQRGYEARWDLRGIDINPDEVRIGTDQGIPIQCEVLENAGFKDGEFDAVTAFSVMEHLQDPFDTLNALARILRPGGLLLIIVPSADALILDLAIIAFKLFGNLMRTFTENVFHEEHLYYFSQKTITQALDSTGFKTLQSFNTPSYLESHPPGHMLPLFAHSLRFFSWALRKQTMLVAMAIRR